MMTFTALRGRERTGSGRALSRATGPRRDSALPPTCPAHFFHRPRHEFAQPSRLPHAEDADRLLKDAVAQGPFRGRDGAGLAETVGRLESQAAGDFVMVPVRRGERALQLDVPSPDGL